MGEFNAGKSSFVNALCAAEVAPTGVTPTTATINVLRYASTPEARVIHHDGSTRAIPTADIAAFLATLRDGEARDVRLVEIFLPVETLRRVEIVDTPGLNSIRPEHERVARDFLRDADAIVWVFAAGQAAKATEREALALAHAAGKRGGRRAQQDRPRGGRRGGARWSVTSRARWGIWWIRWSRSRRRGRSLPRRPGDRTPPSRRWQRCSSAGFSPTRASSSGRPPRRRWRASWRRPGRRRPPLPPRTRARRGARWRALAERLRSALDAERIALVARIEDGYRRAAFEVREFVQPRSWLGGEHRATPADEEFLAELLEDAVARAADGTRAALRAALRPAEDAGEDPALTGKVRARVARAIETAIDRFAAYARGVVEGGAVPDFFRHQLPRLRLEIAAIRDVLVRRAPAPEEPLFSGLRRDLDAAFMDAESALAESAADEVMRALVHDERIARPLDALARAVGALAPS